MSRIREHIERMAHVESVSDERGSDDGVWAYYRPGWKSASDPLGAVHADHEDNWSELRQVAKEAVVCKCEECMRQRKSETRPKD